MAANRILTVKQKGNFQKTDRFLHRIIEKYYRKKLDHYGRLGVKALAAATPRDTGKTAESWGYRIVEEEGKTSIEWTNSNVVNYVNIAVILQYGHATRTGGWVEGRDYINPALRPIFDKIADEAWKEVTR